MRPVQASSGFWKSAKFLQYCGGSEQTCVKVSACSARRPRHGNGVSSTHVKLAGAGQSSLEEVAGRNLKCASGRPQVQIWRSDCRHRGVASIVSDTVHAQPLGDDAVFLTAGLVNRTATYDLTFAELPSGLVCWLESWWHQAVAVQKSNG